MKLQSLSYSSFSSRLSCTEPMPTKKMRVMRIKVLMVDCHLITLSIQASAEFQSSKIFELEDFLLHLAIIIQETKFYKSHHNATQDGVFEVLCKNLYEESPCEIYLN